MTGSTSRTAPDGRPGPEDRSAQLERGLVDRFAGTLVILLPLLFILGRTFADIALIIVGLCFLGRSVVRRDGSWLRQPWVMLGFAWVGWLVFASLFAQHVIDAMGRAADLIRFVVFAAACERLHLRDVQLRGNFQFALAMAVLLVAADCLIQVTTGTSLTGQALPEAYRLSGPFTQQKAGTYLAKTIFVVLLPVLLLVERKEWPAWPPLICLGGIGIIITLTGERSALLSFGLGSLCCLTLLPRLRRLAVPALLAAMLVAALLVAVHPILLERFVGHTENDLSDFSAKRYGQILRTGLALFEEQPITGVGVGEFTRRCLDPRLDDIGPAAVRCVTHPHNSWMEELVEGGVVALALWLAMVAAWLVRFARAGRTIFVTGLAALLQFIWPLMTSMSLFVTWNAVLWWQAVALLLAVSAERAAQKRSPVLPP